MRYSVIAALSLAGCWSTLSAQTPPATDPLRDTVRGAVVWLAAQAVPMPGVEEAVAFPVSEGSKRLAQTCIYGGTAGVLIFLENAAAVLDDATARALADRTAKGLRSARHTDGDDIASWSQASLLGSGGLYTGDAGVGQAFLVRHMLRDDADALAVAADVGDALIARATDTDGALSWGESPDIIYGNAGTALFLLELGKVGKQPRFLDAARRAGRGLVAVATRVPSKHDAERQLPTWLLKLGGREMHMPNFSHGTAGVAYSLVRIGAETGDDELLQAGIDGAEWMIENAVVAGDGLKWGHSDRYPDLYMGGWCHGPAGTGRLFLLLHAVTGEARYLDVARKSAQFVVDYAADAEQKGTDGQAPYVPPSLCCGVAGVVDFFCDLERVTHDAADAAFAHKAGDYLVQVAIADGDGRKWKNGQAVPGGPVAANTTGHNLDLMLGAAGEALALLRLMTIDRDVDPVHSLPDRAITAPPAKK